MRDQDWNSDTVFGFPLESKMKEREGNSNLFTYNKHKETRNDLYYIYITWSRNVLYYELFHYIPKYIYAYSSTAGNTMYIIL